MTADSTSTLSLAGRLRALDDTQLTELIDAREVRDVHINDFFDLADALLEPASIQKALTRLDRPALAALASFSLVADAAVPTSSVVAAVLSGVATAASASVAEPTAATVDADLAPAYALALVDRVVNPDESTAWVEYSDVTAALLDWPSLDLPDLTELFTASAPAGLEPVNDTDALIDHVAAERAFATTSSIAELIEELRREPARELAKGGIALPDTKRLAAAAGVDLDAVAPLLSIATVAGLTASDVGSVLPTAATAEWLTLSAVQRWGRLAASWFDRLPDDIKALMSSRAHSTWGARLAEYLEWLYPAGGDWLHERAAMVSDTAELLGIAANSAPSSPGTALLATGVDAAITLMSAQFPPEVTQVYVQQDLTVMSPGPLRSDLDSRLRTLADVESRGLATTYRVTQAGVLRALAAGESAASLRQFLSEVSLTGIPQPLEYLISGTASRFGMLRVGTDPESGATYIRSDDAQLLATVLVDQTLSALRARRLDDTHLGTDTSREAAFWELLEARYPVAAEDSSHNIVTLEKRRVARAVAPTTESPAVAIVRRLRAVAEVTPADAGKAWFERQIETAIKGKFALTVTVAMPSGVEVEMQLEPAGLSGGRLRARDRKADLERTLPLSSITAISPARP